ncbi:hypothetical protein ANANG_G00064730 [Anguilla anguilla]|uniref:Reverse transcriptase domain-containing protein n=1 Tax=Anguilla anguilla TaxID=7936 RepID=A0A9D3MPI0_ANGAN|nr:hypothetical protein ANANG_G00064730 [Anguilla anguilla]
MNTKQVFQKVKTLTGCEPKPNLCAITDPESFARERNTFYARFDTNDFSAECERWLRALPPPDPEEMAPFTEEEVWRQLSQCKLAKAPGPDGIPARVLKTCALELSPVLHSLFCKSYQTAEYLPLENCYHNPRTQKTPANRTEPLPPRCPHIHNNEVPGEAAAKHHYASCRPTTGSTPICL